MDWRDEFINERHDFEAETEAESDSQRLLPLLLLARKTNQSLRACRTSHCADLNYD